MINIHMQNIDKLTKLIEEENDPVLKAHLMVQLSVVYTLIEMTNKIHDSQKKATERFDGVERRASEIEKKNIIIEKFINRVKWTVLLFSFCFVIVSGTIGWVANEVYTIVSTIKNEQVAMSTKMEFLVKDAKLTDNYERHSKD